METSYFYVSFIFHNLLYSFLIVCCVMCCFEQKFVLYATICLYPHVIQGNVNCMGIYTLYILWRLNINTTIYAFTSFYFLNYALCKCPRKYTDKFVVERVALLFATFATHWNVAYQGILRFYITVVLMLKKYRRQVSTHFFALCNANKSYSSSFQMT